MKTEESDGLKEGIRGFANGFYTGIALILWIWFTGACLMALDMEPPAPDEIDLSLMLGFMTWLTLTITGVNILNRNLNAESGNDYQWRTPLGLMLYVALWVFGIHAILIGLPPFLEAMPFLKEGQLGSAIFVLVLLLSSPFLLKISITLLQNKIIVLQPRKVVKVRRMTSFFNH